MENLFENSQVDVTSLPKAETVDWKPLQKKYLPISLLGSWIFGFILMAIFLVVNFLNTDLLETRWIVWAVVGGIILLFGLISLISVMGFKHKEYAIRERDILYKSGLIFRKTIAIPYNRIQHSEINQGPVERNFNLSQLQIFTAGGHNSDLVIPGLFLEQAQDIKEFVMEKTSQHE